MILSDLAASTLLFPVDTPLSVIESAFLRDEGLGTLLVGDARQPGSIGLIERAQFLTFLSGRLGYGRAIYFRKTLAEYEAPVALILEPTVSVTDAAALAISRGPQRWSDAIVLELREGFAVVPGATVFKHVTDELRGQLETDHLTGVHNRRGFLDRLDEATNAAEGDRLLFLLDLDGFKLVNDALGHQVGDDLLRATARRIKRVMPDAVVARMGGDEFAVLARLGPDTSPEELGLSLVQQLGLPTKVAGTELTVPASVGIAIVAPEATAMELMHRADVALYRAKGAGKNCFCLFDHVIHRDLERQLSISQELRSAIEHDELDLHFQPVVDLDTRLIVAYEALARWTMPSAGPVTPTEFISLAERTGLIVRLGRNLLEKALRRLAAIRDRSSANIHVNMSRRELQQPDLVRTVGQLLTRAGVEPKRLIIEVTETSVAVDTKRMIATMQELSDLGVRIALDDFGAGATALSNLWHFPLDIVKLDQSLISTLQIGGLEGQTSRARLQAIIDLAHAHDLVVTAEGVEHPEQAEVLQRLGCDYGQGWLFGRPSAVMACASEHVAEHRSAPRVSVSL